MFVLYDRIARRRSALALLAMRDRRVLESRGPNERSACERCGHKQRTSGRHRLKTWLHRARNALARSTGMAKPVPLKTVPGP